MYDAHRRRYRAAHVAMRALLGASLGQPPGRLRFDVDANGKPGLVDQHAWQFNLSDSGDWALLGLQEGVPIGVDLEVRRSLDDAPALAERLYTPAERKAVMAAADGPDRESVFLRVWTRKEACLKAVGLGLRLAPASFEVGAHTGTAIALLDTPRGKTAVEVQSVGVDIDAFAAVARIRSPA